MWKELIEEAFSKSGESWEDIIYAQFEDEIISIYEETEEKDNKRYRELKPNPVTDGIYLDDYAFLFWTEKYVYFSHQYDCYRSVEFVPRNPTAERPGQHIGT